MPILIHGGRGLPPIAEHLEALVRRNEGVQLIIAHAGIADMAGLAGRLGGIPGVFFDTSVWSAVDLLDLYRQVAPEQVVYASDYPYGRQPNSLLVAIRTAKLAGFDDKQLRLMLGGTATADRRRDAARAALLPEGHDLARPAADLRAHPPVHLDGGAAALAAPARRDRRDRARGERLPRAGTVTTRSRSGSRSCSSTAQELWRDGAELVSDDERVAAFRSAIQLVNLADMVALTTRA